jgi:hypothetical protein
MRVASQHPARATVDSRLTATYTGLCPDDVAPPLVPGAAACHDSANNLT